jgi:hypothetical protein
MYEYRYTVDENNDGYDDAFVIRRMRQIDFDDTWQIESLAKDCAGDYYDNHDGWDYRSWINGHIDLTIWENEETKHTFQVEVEFDPRFVVRRSE